MARSVDKTDSYIAMVLDLNGRVRTADLQSVPAEARLDALRAFAAAHGAERELHLAGEELIAGPIPDLSAPAQASAPLVSESAPTPKAPADLTPDGQSAIDLLLGDYAGTPVPEAAPAPQETTRVSTGVDEAPRGATATPSGPPAPLAAPLTHELPRDTDRKWLLWWIPTLLLPIIGGSAAWFFLRRTRQSAARAMLGIALVLGLMLSIAWLRYAGEIGAMANQRASESVIVLPAK